MKKIIRKFWGVALVVMMLSSLIVVSAPAGAGNYAFSNSLVTPGSAGDVSNTLAPAGNGFVDVAESTDVIYAIGLTVPGGVYTLYKSADGGATWAAMPGALAAMTAPILVAVAPDDPLTVAIVDNLALDAVYLSTNGGATFGALNPLAAGATISAIDISPLSTNRYVTVGGSVAGPTPYIASWTIGGFAWNTATFTGAPGYAAAFAGDENIVALKYVPTFANEEDLLVVTEDTNVDVTLHIFSYPTAYNGWDTVDPTYPRILEAAGALTVNKATIELDDTFFALANEIGFVSLSTVPELGGVYTVAGVQIFTPAAGINSIAWDGINLMAAPYATTPGAPITIYRSSTALAATPAFLGSNAFKTPGTGTLPLVIFSGGNGYAFSRGQNSAVAMTEDLGATFNGIKLVNSTFGDMIDFWIKSDASAMYAITADAVTSTNALWQRSAGVWTRILIFTAPSTYSVNWLVRAADGDTNAIFLARKTARNVVYSLNGGNTWTTRFSQQNIADVAAASATTIYYASDTSGSVFRGTVGTSIAWTNLGAVAGATTGLFNITLAPGGFVVGSKLGQVAYYNGTALAAAGTFGGGPVVVTASGTASGDIIYAASAAGVVGFGRWTIGTSVAWTAIIAAVPCTGVAYANGVAYAYNDAADSLYRWLPGAGLNTIAGAGTEIFDQTNMVNALQITTGSNTLWARDAVAGVAADTIQSYTEFLLTAMPALTYPAGGEIIPVNSLNGITNPFNFIWTAPVVTALPVGTTYTISVFFDAAGLLPVGTVTAIAGTNYFSATALGPFVAAFTAGETYYWNIQITAPIKSLPSAMQSFTVQQLSAIVPVISSPINGSDITTLNPAFSWEPISGVTSYRFELAKEPTFVLMVYTEDVPGSGAALPVATQLEDGETYFWRVMALTPAEGEWSQVGNFTVAIPVPPPPTSPAPTPTIILPTPTITMPQPTVTVIIPPVTQPPDEKISPAYIWAIIIIGAVLVIAVIVLIVRTRRTV